MDDSQEDDWPSYLPGPRGDILALGVISLNYGYLENIFEILFQSATGMSVANVQAIFPKMQNEVRGKVFKELLQHRGYPTPFDEALLHFHKGFEICAANRHAIMHSFHAGIHTGQPRDTGSFATGGIILSRNTRSGSTVSYYGSRKRLRAVADAIEKHTQYGIALILRLQTLRSYLDAKEEYDFARHPLPDKPPLPDCLETQFQPETQSGARQPQS